MSYLDYEAKDKLVLEACRAKGFVFTDRSGEERIDFEAMKQETYQVMIDDHVVDDQAQVTKLATTQHELFAAIFPDGPGARRQPASLEEAAARDELARKVWSFVNTGTTGYVNLRVEAEGLTLVMCEAPVARTYQSEETGRRKPVTEPGRFLTDNGDLIATHSTLPKAHKLVKAAEAVAKHMAMATRRHPELTAAVNRQITGAISQSRAALSGVAPAKQSALSATKDEGEE